MSKTTGELFWVIPDGYIPPVSSGDLLSHESICVLNCHKEQANLTITIYFEDVAPLENIQIVVQGQRTAHIRTSSLQSGEQKIPVGVPYAIAIESDREIFVQYSRLDSTQPELALMSTMAYAAK